MMIRYEQAIVCSCRRLVKFSLGVDLLKFSVTYLSQLKRKNGFIIIYLKSPGLSISKSSYNALLEINIS